MKTFIKENVNKKWAKKYLKISTKLSIFMIPLPCWMRKIMMRFESWSGRTLPSMTISNWPFRSYVLMPQNISDSMSFVYLYKYFGRVVFCFCFFNGCISSKSSFQFYTGNNPKSYYYICFSTTSTVPTTALFISLSPCFISGSSWQTPTQYVYGILIHKALALTPMAPSLILSSNSFTDVARPILFDSRRQISLGITTF